MTFDYETYLSPFTWRYGSPEMRQLWSEAHKRLLWRQIWVALAEVAGRVRPGDGRSRWPICSRMSTDVDVPRALQIEAEIHHDLMAELKTFAEQAPAGRRHPAPGRHLDGYRRQRRRPAPAPVARPAACKAATRCCWHFAGKIEAWADLPLIAFTHLQPAEPSTLGYRLAQYAQDL